MVESNSRKLRRGRSVESRRAPVGFHIPDVRRLSDEERIVLNNLESGKHLLDIEADLGLPRTRVLQILDFLKNNAEPDPGSNKDEIEDFFDRLKNDKYSINRIMDFHEKHPVLDEGTSFSVKSHVNDIKSDIREHLRLIGVENIPEELAKSVVAYVAFQFQMHVDVNDITQINSFSPRFESLPEEKREGEIPASIEKYDDRKERSESPPDFISRVYSRWLTGEFTRADLRKIDPKATMALYNWERRNGPADIQLPTKKERNDRLLDTPNPGEAPEKRLARQRLEASRRYNERKKTKK